MPAIPIALRGLLWLSSAIGLTSLLTGGASKTQTVENIEYQQIIEQTSFFEKFAWVVFVGVLLLLIVIGVRAYGRFRKWWK